MRPIILLSLLTFLAPTDFAQNLFSFGIKGGVPLTDAFSDNTYSAVDVVTHSFSDSKQYVIGPTAELRLPFGFSVEADALYRPLSLVTDTTVILFTGVGGSPGPTTHSVTNISSWEFPILGKYHFLHTPIVRPYVEAGPIFRALGSGAGWLSNKGFAMGGGVDVKLLVVRVTPEIRYSRWAGDTAGVPGFLASPSSLNQAEFLLGISF